MQLTGLPSGQTVNILVIKRDRVCSCAGQRGELRFSKVSRECVAGEDKLDMSHGGISTGRRRKARGKLGAAIRSRGSRETKLTGIAE